MYQAFAGLVHRDRFFQIVKELLCFRPFRDLSAVYQNFLLTTQVCGLSPVFLGHSPGSGLPARSGLVTRFPHQVH